MKTKQLSLFEKEVIKNIGFTYAGIEYRKFEGLNPFLTNGSRIITYINDAQCSGYESGVTQPIFYQNQEERNSQLKIINNHFGVDENGNNLFGYTPYGIFIKGKEVEDQFGDIFIYGILKLEVSLEEIEKKVKKRDLILKKTGQ